jgi:hypothetical protein
LLGNEDSVACPVVEINVMRRFILPAYDGVGERHEMIKHVGAASGRSVALGRYFDVSGTVDGDSILIPPSSAFTLAE